MATISPARQMYEIVFAEGLWWEQAVGGGIYPNSPYLQVSGTGNLVAATEYARSALKFSASVPAWATVGNIAEKPCVLWLYCDSNTTDSGIQGIRIATISEAWTMASDQPTMRAIDTGTFSAVISSYPTWTGQGWMAFPLTSSSAVLRNANGIVIKMNSDLAQVSSYRFMKDPAPVGRAFLSYDILDTIHGSATARLEATAEALAALTNSQGVYSISGKIIQSNIRPDESDVSIIIGKGSSLAITDHSIQLPETWKLANGNRGALSLSRSAVDLLNYRGAIIEVSLKQKLGYLAETTIATQKGIVGSVEKTVIEQNVTIGDILFESLAMAPYYREQVLGVESVNILSEPRLYALLLILINGGGVPWSRFRQADLVWLLRRFGIVWDDITESAGAMADFTVASFVEEYGMQYGLCISRGLDDSIVVWHPAVYRPSMKVHSVNDTEINDIVYRKVNAIDKYDMIVVGSEDVMWDAALSHQIDGRDKRYTVPTLAGVFVSSDVCQYAIGRQLAQRLVAKHEEYEFSAGARAIDWEIGDKLKITSTRNGLSATVFTIVSAKGDPLTGNFNVTAIRWPDSPGLQSTWEATNLKGIYRLEEWDTAAATGVNQSPIGGAGDMTVTTLNGLVHEDWRGPLANVVMRAPATFMPDGGGGSAKYDLVDFVLGIYGRQSSEPYGGSGRDEMYTRILMFHDLSGTEALVCGIKRVGADNGHGVTYYSTTDTRIFLGATADYTAATITWNASGYTETPPGFATNAASWNYGVAVQWHGDVAKLYVDQILIGTINAFDADIDTCDFHTPIPGEHKIGCIRWLQNSTGWFDVSRLAGRAGEDVYYP